ncbi:MAG: sugar phosphate isomerase/epimerase [Bacteroidetes bacterium]|nr:sugar phosphate isomerase/epimerase [Bacteroidota bacterium]
MAKITACSTLVYTTGDLNEALTRIAIRGFSRVEIAHMGEYCSHYPSGQDPYKVKHLLANHGLKPIAINYFPDHIVGQDMSACKFNVDANARQYESHMQDFIRQMHEVGVPLVLALVGRRTEALDCDQQITAAADVLSRLAGYARRFGIKLALEIPHCYSICNTLQRAKDIFDRIESDNIGAVFDCTHQQVIGYSVQEYLEELGDRLCHVHLRDAAGKDTADFHQNLELTPGRGEVDFRRIARELDDFGYQGEVTLELEYQGGLPLEKIELEVDVAISYLRECGWEFPEAVCRTK